MRMRKPLSTLVLLVLAAVSASTQARSTSFDVPAGPLADALDSLARQGELQILFDRASLAGNASAGLKGEYEPRAALERLLAGSGLKATMTADNAAAVAPMPPIAGKPAVESVTRMPQTLPEMQITATIEPVGYSVASVAAATRTETPLEHVPQSVVVLPKALFNDQGAMTLSDALRNVSNVNAVDARDSNLTGFKIRGFSSATIVDGVAVPGVFQNQESLANVEQISVIKGPSGGLYGGSQGMNYSTLGGAIVLTTAEPRNTPIRRVSASLGSHDHKGASFDFNQPLGASVAFRLIGEYSDTDSEVDRIFFKRTGLFPSLSITPNADTRVVLRLRQSENKTLDYPGLPRANAASPAVIGGVSRKRFIGAEGMPETSNENRGINAQWTQRLNDKWDFALTVARNRLELDQYGAFNASVIDAFLAGFALPAFGSLTQDIYGYRLGQEFTSTVFSPSLSGKFETGSLKHRVSLGIDHEKSSEQAFLRFSDPFGLGISPLGGSALLGGVGVDLSSAIYPAWIEPAGNSLFDSAYRRNFKATTTYVQDQIDAGKWHVLGSLRMNDIEFRQTQAGVASSDATSKAAPRLGVVYEVTPRHSLFVGYGEAVRTPALTAYAAGVTPKPEEVTQIEAGFRVKDVAGLNASVVLFDLSRKNVATASAAFLNYQADQSSKGIDIDLRWQVNPAWQWIAAFTSQTAEYSGTQYAAIANVVGQQLFMVPEQSFRLATRYDIRGGDLNGLGLGLGVTQHARLPGDAANSFFTPAASVWDAQVSYQTGQARFGLNINNLLNKQYLIPSAYFGGGQVTPAAPRTLTATASFSF